MDDYNISYEPMDVDLSSHSTSAMDISYTESNVDISIVKKEKLDFSVEERVTYALDARINNIVPCNKRKVTKSGNSVKLHRTSFLCVGLVVMLISIFTFHIANFNCLESVNIKMLSHNLMTKLYGQSSAGRNIVKALESIESRKILVFYGGTGVGKTFTTSFILENVLDYKNIYHYTMPTFLQTFSSEFMFGLLFCKSATVVVDDLTKNDIYNIYEPIRELIIKSERLSKNLTIILIFNCDVTHKNFFRKCDDLFISELKQSLVQFEAHKYYIKFETLTEEHLRKCIEQKQIDRKLSALDIEKIVKKFNVSRDGCKGVHHKLQYLKYL